MTRYAVALVIEKDQPVGRPMWLAAGVRANVNTDEPAQAATYAKPETAQRWAETLSFTMPSGEVIYRYEAVEAPYACAACGTFVVNDGGVAFQIATTIPHTCP